MYNTAHAVAASKNSSSTANRSHFWKVKYPDNRAHVVLKDERPSVRDLASVLLVFVRWDKTAFTDFQDAIAHHVTRICNPPKPYTGKQMRDALKRLKELNKLHIPRRLDPSFKLAKKYTFTKEFLEIASAPKIAKPENENPEMCDNSLPRRKSSNASGTVCHGVSKKPQQESSNCNRDRAREHIDKDEKAQPREPEKNRATKKKKAQRRQYNPIRDLGKYRRSVIWWIRGSEMVNGELEAIELAALFLANQADPFFQHLENSWFEMTKTERAFKCRQIVARLREYKPKEPPPAPRKKSRDWRSAWEMHNPGAPDIHWSNGFDLQKFKGALLFGDDYDGPGLSFIEKFRKSNAKTQETMLKDLSAGRVKLE